MEDPPPVNDTDGRGEDIGGSPLDGKIGVELVGVKSISVILAEVCGLSSPSDEYAGMFMDKDGVMILVLAEGIELDWENCGMGSEYVSGP